MFIPGDYYDPRVFHYDTWLVETWPTTGITANPGAPPAPEQNTAGRRPPESANKATANPKDAFGLRKPPLRLLPGPALVLISLVLGLGAKKYGPYNWRGKKVLLTVYIEAAMRHLLSCLDGEWNDRESGQPHLAHVGACALIVLDAACTGNLIIDLPPKGSTAELIAANTRSTDE